MANTPIFALVYPTTATQLTPLASQFAALAQSVEAAMANSQSRMIGTTAARTALTAPQLKEGLTFYNTDTKREWKYDGSNWISNEGGMQVVYPSSVVGGTIQADGSVIPNGVSSLSFNGSFSSRYRKYRLEYTYSTNVASGGSVRWRNSGVDKADANFYSWAQNYTVTGTITGGSSSGTAQSTTLVSASFHSGYIEFGNPGQTSTPKFINTYDITAPQTGLTETAGWSSNDTGTYDGFTISIGSATFSTTAYARFKLYAYA